MVSCTTTRCEEPVNVTRPSNGFHSCRHHFPMAIDSPDSNHKHRRSTPDDDEPQEPSKRPKHKHRHHHRSNRRHRSSKNRDQESKDEFCYSSNSGMKSEQLGFGRRG
ncbi:hypothetical protein Droror1_Dr00018861 [Drosera rotundifolia]